MQYPKDCGVSAIRFHLRDPDHPLAKTAAAAVSAAHHDAGYMLCQCGVPDWWRLHRSANHALQATLLALRFLAGQLFVFIENGGHVLEPRDQADARLDLAFGPLWSRP